MASAASVTVRWKFPRVRDPSARIHALAEVEDDVDVGARTAIWNRAQVRAGAKIGADCILGRDAYIDEGVTLGDRVKIGNGALLYRGSTVENDVFVGPRAILTNDRFPRAITSTGELARDQDWEISPIALKRGCSIGAGAVIVAGVDVGMFATVGAGAVVTRSVAAHALVAGNPARGLGWVCACGQRLNDSTGQPAPAERERYAIDPDLACANCGRHYVFVREARTLEERTGPRQAAPT
jgi:UDP-2-acetamido-3-amino-2,3-dideoxy-glucuronate N-acetyltransferase